MFAGDGATLTPPASRCGTAPSATSPNTSDPDTIRWRRVARHIRRAFDLSSDTAVEDDVYDGDATVHLGDATCLARVRLTGHFDPIDGHYHWQGTVFGRYPEPTNFPSRPP